MENLKVFYIFHSSFVIESKDSIFIFDFYKFPDKKNDLRQRANFLSDFIKRKEKKVFVFSSHSHSDHFSEEVLDWAKINENIIYIFSNDIKKYEQKNIIYVKENDKLKIKNIKIKVYGSTDLGVSFYLSLKENNKNINIFHSGDLHLWHWEDDTLEEEKEMREKYLSILNKIKKENLDKLDFAFVPVDPRLGKNTFEGVEIFNNFLNPKYIVPIHFQEDYLVINNLLKTNINKEKIIKMNETMIRIF